MSDTENSNCTVCAGPITVSEQTVKTPCAHYFHPACLQSWLKRNPTCPQCKSKCDYKACKIEKKQVLGAIPKTTSARLSNSPSNSSAAVNPTDRQQITAGTTSESIGSRNERSLSEEDDRIRTLVSAIVQARQASILEEMEQNVVSRIESRIESTLANLIANLNLNTNARVATPVREDLDLPPQVTPYETETPWQSNTIHDGVANFNRQIDNLRLSDSSTISSSRVAHLISSWDIKFDDTGKLSVESFINRIESQVQDTLSGNFYLLCEHIQSLLVGDAKDWYWTYRRTVQKVVWKDLCRALRMNFAEHRDDSDIVDIIKNTKQGANETFDSYRNNIYKYLERLQQPIPEHELVKIMQKGLRPRLRQQLLFVDIKTIAELRRLCLRGESLYQELSRTSQMNIQATSSKPPIRRFVNELEAENEYDFPEETVDVEEIKKNDEHIKCWNCQKKGHRYQDCLETRTVFCYGCGELNTYKPNCSKCKSGNWKQSEVFGRKPR